VFDDCEIRLLVDSALEWYEAFFGMPSMAGVAR
jgi:hypothetical protein